MWTYDPTSDELKDKEENTGPDLSGGSVSGASAPNPGTNSTTPTSSGQYTNFNKYLEVNQPQSEALGQKVAQGIDTKTNAANSALEAGQNDFNQKIANAGPGISKEDLAKLTPDQLAEYAKDPNNVAKFQNSAKGEYSGPGGFSDVTGYEDLVKNLGSARDAATNAKTVGGQEQLIKDVYSNPSRAKQGMLSLDQSLLHGTPTAFKPVQDAAAKAGGLDARKTQIEADATKAVDSKKSAVTDAYKQIQSQFLGDNGYYNQLLKGIDSRTTGAQNAAEQARDEAKNYLNLDWLKNEGIYMPSNPGSRLSDSHGTYIDPSKVNISDAALSQLGITKDQYIDLINKEGYAQNYQGPAIEGLSPVLSNFDPYAKYGDITGINRGNVATQGEYDELGALSKLLGTDAVDQSYLNTQDQAGKYNSDVTDFNYSDLINYLNSQQSAIDASMASQPNRRGT